MSDVVYLDSRFLSPGEPATVSIFDRGYLLGDSVFASTRIERGRAVALSLHIARFVDAARGTGIAVPEAPAIERVVHEACARFGEGHGYLRITATRGEGPPGLAPDPSSPSSFSVVVRALASAAFPAPTALRVASLRSVPAACVDPRWKTGSYANRVAMRREASLHGAREALVLAIDGELVSGIASNVFLVIDGAVHTPHLASGCRPGVTREIALGLLAARGVEVHERRLERDAIDAAEAIVLTSALLPILRASDVEGRSLSGSPIVETLEADYLAATRARA